MFKTRNFTALLISTVLVVCCVFSCFIFSASAANNSTNASLMSLSKFRWNNVGGRLRDEAPYPDGEFLEFYDGSHYRIFNFKPQEVYAFGDVDKYTGNVINSYCPPCWRINADVCSIYSSYPIYRCTSYSSPNWAVAGSSGGSAHQTFQITNSDGTVTTLDSEICKQTFTTTQPTTDYTIISTCPSVYYVGSLLNIYTGGYTVAPMFGSDYLASVSTSAEVTDLQGLYDTSLDILDTLTSVDSTEADIYSSLSDLSEVIDTIDDNIAQIDLNTAGILNLCTTYMYQYWQYFGSILDTLSEFHDDVLLDFWTVEDQLQQIIDGGESFDSESVFGTDESGLSDVTEDFDFAGSGIESVASTLGNSFNLIKVNFEAICNLFGLNEVIVLLLGFAVICFILGRVVNNRMRGT